MPSPFPLYCLATAILLMVGGFAVLSIIFVTCGALFELAVFASAGVVSDYDVPVATDEEIGPEDGTR